MPEPPVPQLNYRSGRDEPLPPSASRIFAGVVWAFLSLVAAIIGLLVVAVILLDRSKTRGDGPDGSVFCALLTVLVMLSLVWSLAKLAKRQFRRQPRTGEIE